MAVTESPKTPEPAKTTETKATTTKADEPKPARSTATANAGESGDPAVQYLLAVRQGHLMNRDLLDPPLVDTEALERVDEQIADVDDQLAELGYPQESPADRKAGLEKAAEEARKREEATAKRRADRAEARSKAHAHN